MTSQDVQPLDLKPDFSQFKHQLEDQEVRVKRVDLDGKANEIVISIITAAIKNNLPRTDFYAPLTDRIRKRVDEQFGPSWCCLVGSNFTLNTNNKKGMGYAHYRVGPYIHVVLYRTSKLPKKPPMPNANSPGPVKPGLKKPLVGGRLIRLQPQ